MFHNSRFFYFNVYARSELFSFFCLFSHLLFVFGTKTQIFSLKKQMNLSETRSLRLYFSPALRYKIKYIPGTIVRTGEWMRHLLLVIQCRDILQNLLISELLEGLLPGEGEDLPERDTKRPNIALCCIFGLKL